MERAVTDGASVRKATQERAVFASRFAKEKGVADFGPGMQERFGRRFASSLSIQFHRVNSLPITTLGLAPAFWGLAPLRRYLF
jgi:hypothetical protein